MRLTCSCLHIILTPCPTPTRFPASEAGGQAPLQEQCTWLGSGATGQLYPLGVGTESPVSTAACHTHFLLPRPRGPGGSCVLGRMRASALSRGFPSSFKPNLLCSIQRADQGKMVGQWLRAKAQEQWRREHWWVRGRIQMDGYGSRLEKL